MPSDPRLDPEALAARLESLERRLARLESGGAPEARAETPPIVEPTPRAPEAAPHPRPPHPIVERLAARRESPAVQATRPAPRPAAARERGSALERAERFVGTKLIAWIGGIALLLGTAFFLKLAFDKGWISPKVRVLMGAAAGLALFAGAEVLHRRRLGAFAATLAGSGVAILTLTNWGAFALYGISSFPVAFGLGIGITALGFSWGVGRAQLAALLLAELGGFLNPVLIQKESTGPWPLALYLGALTAASAWAGRARAWRSPLLFAVAGTLAVETGWLLHYASFIESEWPVATALALTLLVAIPTLDAGLRAQRGTPTGRREAAVLLVLHLWGALGLAAALLRTHETALGEILLGYALLPFAIAWRGRPEARAVRSVSLGIGIAAVTGGLGALFDGAERGVAWAAWAAALALLERRSQAVLPLLGSMVVHALVGAWIASLGEARENTNYLWSERATVCAAEALALFATERSLRGAAGARAWVGRAAMAATQVAAAALLHAIVPASRLSLAWFGQAAALAFLSLRTGLLDYAACSFALVAVAALRFHARGEMEISRDALPFANVRAVSLALAAVAYVGCAARLARTEWGAWGATLLRFLGIALVALALGCELAFLRSRAYGDLPPLLDGDLSLGSAPYAPFWNGRFLFLAGGALAFAASTRAAWLGGARAADPLAARTGAALHTIVAHALLWSALCLEALGVSSHEIGSDPTLLTAGSSAQAALSIALGAYPAAVLLLGFRRSRVHRLFGLAGLLATVAKVFLVDLASVALEWRMLVMLGLGAVLLLGAYFYARAARRAAS